MKFGRLGAINEELLSILQQNQEKLDQLLEAQPVIPGEAWAVIEATIVALLAFAGVVYAARAAKKRQRNQLVHDRERQRKELHREKLEEAIQALLSLRRWALTSAHDVKALFEEARDTGNKPPIEDWTKLPNISLLKAV